MKRKNSLVFQAIFGSADDPKKLGINCLIVLATAALSIIYSQQIIRVAPQNNIVSGLVYVLKYIPFILAAAFGGAVPGLMAVLIVFFHKSFAYSSFSYLTFIYLMVVIVVEAMAKKRFFKRWYTTLLAGFFLQLLTGVFWSIALWLLAGKSVSSLDPNVFFNCFLNEMPGSYTSCFIVYFVYRFISVDRKRLVNNGKYYIDEEYLTDDEKYEIYNKSKIGQVILRIVVFEAIVLGVSAEIASNTLVPTMKYVTEPNRQEISIEEDYSHVKNAGILESRVSFKLQRDA